MAENESGSEKTEEPTQKRLEDAFDEGKVAFSREVSNALFLGLLFLYMVWFIPSILTGFTVDFTNYISKSYSFSLDENNLDHLLKDVVFAIFALVGFPIAFSIVVAVASSFLQNGRFNFSAKSLEPKFEKISPLAGFKRLFSFKSVLELLKGFLKIIVIGFMGYLIVKSSFDKIINLANYDLKEMLKVIFHIIYQIILFSVIFIFLIAGGDFIYQKFSFFKSMMMTRQELKDELKQSDGDPQIKARIRKLRMQKAVNKVAKEVPKSSVVVRNPTHYAVALKYEEEEMDAPILVAKGQDFLALKIIEIAEKNKVPVVENRPLARALYETAEIGKQIPLEQFQAVAEVIKYIYQLKGRG